MTTTPAVNRDILFEHELTKQALRKAEAELAEIKKKRPFGCKCETLHHHIAGDGCDECNKALVIEMLTDERDELQAELDALKATLNHDNK